MAEEPIGCARPTGSVVGAEPEERDDAPKAEEKETRVSIMVGRKALGVEVLSVSVDSQFVHKIWDENELSKMTEGGIPFPMIADAAGHLGTAYGVYDDEAGVNVRGRFIIDPDGVVQAMEVLTPPVGRKVAETLRQIKAYQHVRATGG